MKEELIVLGTGNASVTKCFNTCFVIKDEKGEFFLVDAGGGNGVLRQLEKSGIDVKRIQHMFVTHEHTDHLLGAVWIIRIIATAMTKDRYDGFFYIYCHKELCETLDTIARLTLTPKFYSMVHNRILFVPVEHGQTKKILDYKVTFFDIHSTKAKQFGFTTVLNNGKKLTCCGDEPYQDHCYEYAVDADWLLHEAFCLYDEREKYHPYEICHSTVKDACELATKLNIKNLVMWHTEDDTIRKRKSLYKKEGRKYYKGNLFVPYDLERIAL